MGNTDVLSPVQLLVDPAIAEMIKKNGIAEIVIRRKDKKFFQFINAKIADNQVSEEAKKRLLDAAMNIKASDGKIADSIRNAIDKINLANKKLPSIDSGLKSVSKKIESVFKLSSVVRAIPYINVALTAANIGVDIAGFVIIAKKMKGLSEQINQIAVELSYIKDISVENMRSDCEKLCLDYNTIVTKIHDGDKLERDDLEEYLKQAKPYISKLIRLLLKGSVDAETLLNMVFTLLPAYTSVLCLFLRLYYFEKHSTPFNYDSFLEVYQEINDSQFRDAVQDYYLLNKGYSYRDVIDILNVQVVSVFNERLEIEDQLDLIKVFGTDEAYCEFERALDAAVEKEIEKRADEIAEKCGECSEECRRILRATA